jgi:hypothetical protein
VTSLPAGLRIPPRPTQPLVAARGGPGYQFATLVDFTISGEVPGRAAAARHDERDRVGRRYEAFLLVVAVVSAPMPRLAPQLILLQGHLHVQMQICRCSCIDLAMSGTIRAVISKHARQQHPRPAAAPRRRSMSAHRTLAALMLLDALLLACSLAAGILAQPVLSAVAATAAIDLARKISRHLLS